LRDGRSCSGFAAGDADYAEDGDFAEGGSWDEDAVGIGVEIGRSDLDAVVEEREQVVGDDAFQGFAVEKAKPEPEAIEFGAAEEGFALGLEVVIEIAHEIDAANLGKREFFVFPVLGQEIEGIDLAETRGIQVTAERLAVVQRDNDLFVGRSWGAEFQGTGFRLREMADLQRKKLYVMLSAKFLSTYCF